MNKLDNEYITKYQNYETGFNSITTDNKHIILWDFDGVSKKDVSESLIEIQKQFNLSNIFLLLSRNGYNAICLDKYTRDKVFLIKSLTTLSDKQHDISGYKHNGWTLRIGNDKKLDTVLLGVQRNYPKSNAHRQLLEVLFDVKLMKISSFDGFGTVLFEKIYRNREAINGKKKIKIRDRLHK